MKDFLIKQWHEKYIYAQVFKENVNVFKSLGQDTLIMMTREFDPITEKSLHPDSFGAGKNTYL